MHRLCRNGQDNEKSRMDRHIRRLEVIMVVQAPGEICRNCIDGERCSPSSFYLCGSEKTSWGLGLEANEAQIV